MIPLVFTLEIAQNQKLASLVAQAWEANLMTPPAMIVAKV
jgi:hypothetical protein